MAQQFADFRAVLGRKCRDFIQILNIHIAISFQAMAADVRRRTKLNSASSGRRLQHCEFLLTGALIDLSLAHGPCARISEIGERSQALRQRNYHRPGSGTVETKTTGTAEQ